MFIASSCAERSNFNYLKLCLSLFTFLRSFPDHSLGYFVYPSMCKMFLFFLVDSLSLFALVVCGLPSIVHVFAIIVVCIVHNPKL